METDTAVVGSGFNKPAIAADTFALLLNAPVDNSASGRTEEGIGKSSSRASARAASHQ